MLLLRQVAAAAADDTDRMSLLAGSHCQALRKLASFSGVLCDVLV